MTQVLRFDGVNDYVQLPAAIPAMPNDWQIETKITILANTDILLLGRTTAARYISLRVSADQIRVTGTTGTAYDIPCVLNVGETCTLNIVRTLSPNRITVLKNGVQAGQITFSQGIDSLDWIGRYISSYSNFDLYYLRVWDATNNYHYSADGITSGTVLPELNNSANNGTLINFSATPWINDELFTLPTTIVPAANFTSTVIAPFTNGTATINYSGGVTSTVTIAGMQFTTAMPLFVDNGLYPKIPLTAQVNLSQGATSSTLFRPIALPTNYQTLRDTGGNPVNFSNIIIDDDEYIGWWFNDAGNPLTVNDTAYWDASSGLIINPDGSYELPLASAPLTTTLTVRRGADNKTYFHTLIFSEQGIIVGGEFGSDVIGIFIGIGI